MQGSSRAIDIDGNKVEVAELINAVRVITMRGIEPSSTATADDVVDAILKASLVEMDVAREDYVDGVLFIEGHEISDDFFVGHPAAIDVVMVVDKNPFSGGGLQVIDKPFVLVGARSKIGGGIQADEMGVAVIEGVPLFVVGATSIGRVEIEVAEDAVVLVISLGREQGRFAD